jgi:uncharacterized protein YdhG (YjbR/CyaY superfamily)
MAQSKAATVDEYLQELPENRRETISEVRDLILEHIPDGYRETMNWGMINYEIPLERYPDTYNDQPLRYLALAAQKNYNALYIMSVYQDKELYSWLKNQFKEAGKKFDMGKSCLRFKSTDDLEMDAIKKIVAHQTPDEFIESYEASRKK